MKRHHQVHRDPLLALRIIGKARARQSREALDAEQARALAIGYHSALHAITTGAGTENDACTLACAANIALLLCESGLGAEYIDDVRRAQDAIVALMARGSSGRWLMDGPGIKAVQTLVELHDAQIAHPDCTEGRLAAAIGEVHKRMQAGQVLEVA